MGYVKLCIIIKLEMFKYLCRKIFQSNQFCTKNKIHSLCDTGCLYSWQGMVYHSWCQIHQTLYILCLNRKNTKNHGTFFFWDCCAFIIGYDFINYIIHVDETVYRVKIISSSKIVYKTLIFKFLKVIL